MTAIWVAILVLIVAAIVVLIVSALHYALADFSMVKLDQLVEKRGRKDAIDRVLDDLPGHMLATGAVRVVASVVIAVACVVALGVFYVKSGSVPGAEAALTLSAWRLAFSVVLASMVIYAFGVVLPLSIAAHAGERAIFAFHQPLRALHLFARPLRLVSVIDIAIKRLAGVAHVSEAEEAEDEILSAVSEGEREGSIGEEERVMIEGVVELRSQTVEEIMTPRTEIEGFELTDDLAFIRTFIEEAGHSRIPVYEGDLDHIVGILYVKDLLHYLGKDVNGFQLRPILRKPVWVPETKTLSEMMVELRARKVHLAIVLDEYGGTTGLVTFEDILEEIVGEIQDEFEPDDEVPPEIMVDEQASAAEIDARAYIDDANSRLKAISVELPISEDYDTVGGYVLQELGHIPVAGECFEAPGLAVCVLTAEATRVTRVRIEYRAEAEMQEDDASMEADAESPGNASAPPADNPPAGAPRQAAAANDAAPK